MKFKIILFAVAVFSMFSCSKENSKDNSLVNVFREGQQVTVGVDAGKSSTKVVGTDDPTNNEIDFIWEEGDKILVTVGSAPAEFTLASGAGTAIATFKGTMPASGSTFDIQYPVSEPDLNSQTYAEDGKLPEGKIAFAATGCTLNNTNELNPANSVLKLNLYGTSQTISKIVVTNVSNSDNPTYTLNISGGKELGTTAENATPFFVVVPNGEYKIDVGIYDNSATPALICTFTTSGELCFADAGNPGSCIDMPAKEVASSAYEAQIGSTNYSTLAEAITTANATSDATIELLKDVTVADMTLSISASMTIDMSGFSITTSSAFDVAENKTLTIKDGNFVGCFSFTGSGAADITNCNVTSDANALSCTGGTLTVNSGKFKGNIYVTSPGTIQLKGGIYSAEPSAYKASGYSVHPNPDESTSTEYPYAVGGPAGGGLDDIKKTGGSW